jgi:hypothetical protein
MLGGAGHGGVGLMGDGDGARTRGARGEQRQVGGARLAVVRDGNAHAGSRIERRGQPGSGPHEGRPLRIDRR